jgi:hypothetical protein
LFQINPKKTMKKTTSSILAGLIATAMATHHADAAITYQTLMFDDIETGGSVTKDDNFIANTDATAVGDRAEWQAPTGSAWTYGVGANSIYNITGDNEPLAEMAVAAIVDVTTVSWGDLLNLSFGFRSGDTDDFLNVHLIGLVEATQPGDGVLFSINNPDWLTDWTSVGTDRYTAYNLLNEDTGGVFGKGSAAVSGLAGSGAGAGFVPYSYEFDLSGFTTAPDDLGGYDYIMVAFQSTFVGTQQDIRVNDILLTVAVPEPSSTALLGLGGLALMLRRKRS